MTVVVYVSRSYKSLGFRVQCCCILGAWTLEETSTMGGHWTEDCSIDQHHWSSGLCMQK